MLHTPRWKSSLTNLNKEAYDRATSSEFKFTDYSDVNPNQSKLKGSNKSSFVNSKECPISLKNKKKINEKTKIKNFFFNSNSKKQNSVLSHTRNINDYYPNKTVSSSSDKSKMIYPSIYSTSSRKSKKKIKLISEKAKTNVIEQKGNNQRRVSIIKADPHSRRQSILSKILEDSPHKDHEPIQSLTERGKDENTKFLKLVADLTENETNNEKKQLQLVNELRKLKTNEPKQKEEKLPVFKSGTKLNNYLIRGFIFMKENGMEAKEIAKQKELVSKVTEEIKKKRKKKEIEKYIQNNTLESKPVTKKVRSRKTTQQRLSMFSMLIQEHQKRKMNYLKDKLERMTQRLIELEKTNYVDISNRPNKINRDNLSRVIKLLKIVKLKKDHNDLDNLEIILNDQFFDECLEHEFEVMKTLKQLGQMKFLKNKLQTKTLRKFYSVKGNYL